MKAEKYNWRYSLKERFFRLISSKKIHPNNIIICCNPRSGSTWLFDALRSHPKITFPKLATFHARFQIQGNRYPGDLVQGKSGVSIEIRPGRRKRIKKIKTRLSSKHDLLNLYFIEKIHPHFYHYETEKLISQINQVQKNGKVFKFIILV